MINILVFSEQQVDIESESFTIETRADLVRCLQHILNKAYYSGETLCIETADVNTEKGLVSYTLVEMWK